MYIELDRGEEILKKQIIMTVGLPGSGKTTWAKNFMEENPGSYKRVNKDDLRSMLDLGKYSKKNERFVLYMRDCAIAKALDGGWNVIVDDTNLSPKHQVKLEEIADQHGAKVMVQDFTDVSVKECIKRDLQRPNSVGTKVIWDMYLRYMQDQTPVSEPNSEEDDRIPVIIADVDGTLAYHSNRMPHEYEKLDTDTLIVPIRDALNSLVVGKGLSCGVNVIIVSGRPSEHRVATEKWLANNGIVYRDIFMRPEGDYREDTIIKREIYENFIAPEYKVLYVLDDRDRVVAMWRSLGHTVLQTAEGGF